MTLADLVDSFVSLFSQLRRVITFQKLEDLHENNNTEKSSSLLADDSVPITPL